MVSHRLGTRFWFVPGAAGQLAFASKLLRRSFADPEASAPPLPTDLGRPITRRAGNAVEPDPVGARGVQGVSFAICWL